MSLLPTVTIRPDYPIPDRQNSTWAIDGSKQVIKMIAGNTKADGTFQIGEVGARISGLWKGPAQLLFLKPIE
ncbi:MAG: hypothetical protein QNJ27_02445 [Simkaniaceae bacterium]|nr:hypothetical protein [Simkaniaceae bacterium]